DRVDLELEETSDELVAARQGPMRHGALASVPRQTHAPLRAQQAVRVVELARGDGFTDEPAHALDQLLARWPTGRDLRVDLVHHDEKHTESPGMRSGVQTDDESWSGESTVIPVFSASHIFG